MATSLEKFLSVKPFEPEYQTLQVKAGFNKNAIDVEVKVRGLDPEEFKRVKKRSTETYTNTATNASSSQIEEIEFCQQLAALGLVEPDLNNKQLRDHFKAFRKEDLITKMFPISSIISIGNAVAELTAGDLTDNESKISEGTDPDLIEEAKN